MEIYHWIIAGFIAIPIFLIFLSIPSFISMYKIGRKEYFKILRILKKSNKGLNLCYELETMRTRTYTYPSGKKQSIKERDIDYYFPIYINDNQVYIIHKKSVGFFTKLSINDAKFTKDNGWETDLIEVKNVECIYRMFFKDRLDKKIEKISMNPIKLDDIDNLNELINSEITSIRRESKLNLIMNG